jgi:hypothetical protein
MVDPCERPVPAPRRESQMVSESDRAGESLAILETIGPMQVGQAIGVVACRLGLSRDQAGAELHRLLDRGDIHFTRECRLSVTNPGGMK